MLPTSANGQVVCADCDTRPGTSPLMPPSLKFSKLPVMYKLAGESVEPSRTVPNWSVPM